MRSHFWAPNNEANRHLAQMTEQERMTLRDIPRRRVGPPGVGGAAPYAQTTVDSSGMIAEKMGEVTKPHALTGNQLLRVKQQPSRLEWKEDCAETSESREHNAEHSPPQALKVATRMFKDPQELGAWYNELSSDEEKPRERDDSSAPETSRRRAVAEGGEGQSDDSAYTSSDSDGEVGRPVRAASPQGVKRTGARVNDERRGKTKDGRGAGEAKKKEGKTMGTVGRKDRVFVDVISGKPVRVSTKCVVVCSSVGM